MNSFKIRTIKRFGPSEKGLYTWKLELDSVDGSVAYFDTTGSALSGFSDGDELTGYELVPGKPYNGQKQWKLRLAGSETRQSFPANGYKPQQSSVTDPVLKADIEELKKNQERLLKGMLAIHKLIEDSQSFDSFEQ